MQKIISYFLSFSLVVGSFAPLQAAARQQVPAKMSKVSLALVEIDAAKLNRQRVKGIKDSFANKLKATGRFTIVRPQKKQPLSERPKDKEGLQALQQTRQLFKDGREKFFNSHFEAAFNQLSKARRGYIRALYLLADSKELFSVHLLLGRTLLALGKNDEGKQMLARAIFIDPKANLSTKDYPPAVLRLIAEIKQQQQNLPQVQMEVASQPQGARVYANGKRIGITPLTIELPSGEYFIRLTKDGYRDWYSSVEIAPGNSRLERVLVQAGGGEVTDGKQFAIADNQSELPPQRLDFLAETAFTLAADYILLSDLRGEQLRGQLFDVRTQELSPISKISLGASAAEEKYGIEVLSRKLSAYINSAGYLVMTAGKQFQERRGKPVLKTELPANMQAKWQKRSKNFDFASRQKVKPWYKKWWVWVLVAGVGAGGYFAVRKFSDSGNKIIVSNP